MEPDPIQEWIDRQLERAPELTKQQLTELRMLLNANQLLPSSDRNGSRSGPGEAA